MSIKTFQLKKTTISVLTATALLALGACSSSDDQTTIETNPGDGIEQPDSGATQTVAVSLDASQEIPAPSGVPSGASGSAEVSVDATGVVTAGVGVSNLSGPASMVHIHRGFVGSTGPVVVGLTSDDGGSTWTVPVDAPPLTDDEIDAFNRGELYFNVHTAANIVPGCLHCAPQ